jgi:hypothetical protein
MDVQREPLPRTKVLGTWLGFASSPDVSEVEVILWVCSKKEKAHEGMWFLECNAALFLWCDLDQYVHRHEQEQLAKLKAEVRTLQKSFSDVWWT